MKTFIAAAIASLLCLCTFRVPVVAQATRNLDAVIGSLLLLCQI